MRDTLMMILTILLILIGGILVGSGGRYRYTGIGLIVAGGVLGLITAKVFKISFI